MRDRSAIDSSTVPGVVHRSGDRDLAFLDVEARDDAIHGRRVAALVEVVAGAIELRQGLIEVCARRSAGSPPGRAMRCGRDPSPGRRTRRGGANPRRGADRAAPCRIALAPAPPASVCASTLARACCTVRLVLGAIEFQQQLPLGDPITLADRESGDLAGQVRADVDDRFGIDRAGTADQGHDVARS